ncbi:hypothetical protein AHF37_08262 [Paragonimus kellicotti]|nr:hypothetical protein AHF37_08262 [Paragonimus kellicotti]
MIQYSCRCGTSVDSISHLALPNVEATWFRNHDLLCGNETSRPLGLQHWSCMAAYTASRPVVSQAQCRQLSTSSHPTLRTPRAGGDRDQPNRGPTRTVRYRSRRFLAASKRTHELRNRRTIPH